MTGIGRVLVPVRRGNPVVVGWRWRYELAAAVLTAWLVARVGPLWTVVDWAAVGAGVAVTPARRWAWAVVTPHRVRSACAHAWLHSRTGRLPMVLRTRVVPRGEEVQLLLRAGLSVQDLADAAGLLATACWAGAVLVEADPRRAQVVRLTVLRR